MSHGPAERTTFQLVAMSCLFAACTGNRATIPPPREPLVPTPVEAFRVEPPEPETIEALELPEVYRHRLPNGLSLILCHRPGGEIAAVRYVTRRGGEGIPRELAGRSWLVGRIIHLSASADGGESRRTLATEGFDASVAVGFESASASVLASRERVTEAIELLARAIREPSFNPGRVEEARRDALEQLGRIRSSPDRRSYYWAMGMLYGLDHRAAVPIYGRAADVRSVSAAELRAHHHIAWGPSNSALVVVGDMEPRYFTAIAEGAFGGWTTEGAPPLEATPWVAIDSPDVARGLGLRSGFDRSLVTFVERAPSRRSEDYLPFRLIAAMLGGLRSSRSNELLQQRGVAARIESDYQARLRGGELVVTASTARRGIADVLVTVTDELERLVADGPAEDELDAARAVVREQIRANLDENSSLAALLAGLFLFDVGLEEVQRIDGELMGVTPEVIRRTARRWLRPERAPVVVTGNLEAIGMAFNRADLGLTVMRNR